jgi:purine-cytosine permease-like protein
MTYLKIVQYVYLVFALFFFYDAYSKAMNGENYWLSVIIAVVAIGMFFFRRHFYNKHQNPNK